MFGKNPIRKPALGDGLSLDVVEIFSTLQGEGPNVGHPSVFIRLGGCNLACDFCDTEFENFSAQPLDDIIKQIDATSCEGEKRVRHLVVITGGEPMRQPIVRLCEALIADGFTVQIETNGTLYQPLPAAVEIICSPKASNGAYFPVRDDILMRANALKFIISADESPYDSVPDVGQKTYKTPVYVQPMDSYDKARNEANMRHALALAQTHGYRLSLQIHKWLGIA